ncbi:hypothetical protein PRZ61_10860 [Halomonas pacifica]|uniref:hypothetical protein n=1 Tax=Bisbaumannia pacifica TaxID=77098 RepID=UPI002358A32C|nr:hypothetical protein [Halomonas pacifica]MDC8803936.1 hypothetical protein [Halomonas pacifica]
MQVISREEAITQGLREYFTGKPCKYGHVAGRKVSNTGCVECVRSSGAKYREKNKDRVAARKHAYHIANREKKAEYNRRYAKENAERIARQKRQWNRDNKDQKQEYNRKYYLENKDRMAVVSRRWYLRNKEKVLQQVKGYQDEHRESRNARLREKAKRPEVKAERKMREFVHRCVRHKKARTKDILGYTPEQLREHLERQFVKGMSWENHGTEWHIDHIIPISRLLAQGETDPAVINCLSNLRPLWAKDNLSKSNQVQSLL